MPFTWPSGSKRRPSDSAAKGRRGNSRPRDQGADPDVHARKVRRGRGAGPLFRLRRRRPPRHRGVRVAESAWPLRLHDRVVRGRAQALVRHAPAPLQPGSLRPSRELRGVVAEHPGFPPGRLRPAAGLLALSDLGRSLARLTASSAWLANAETSSRTREIEAARAGRRSSEGDQRAGCWARSRSRRFLHKPRTSTISGQWSLKWPQSS